MPEDGAPEPARRFAPSRGDITLQFNFSEPAFELMPAASLAQRLFERLAPLGLRLVDIRVETGAGSFGDANLVCTLLNISAVLRVYLDRVELHFVDVKREVSQSVREVISAVFDERTGLPSIRTYSFSLGLHGLVDGLAAKEFLVQFSRRTPKTLGPLVATGVVFYFAEVQSRMTSDLTIDASAVIPSGVFLRFHATWDAEKASVDQGFGLSRAFVMDAMAALGLTLGEVM